MIYGIIGIIIGIAILLWGYKLFRIWLAIAGLLLGAAFGYQIGLQISTTPWPTIIAILIGIVLALLSYFIYKVGAVILGALLGAVFFALLLSTFGVQVEWWIYIIGAVIGGALTGMFIDAFIIINTAFNGSYFITVSAYGLIMGGSTVSIKDHLLSLDFSFPWYIILIIAVLTVIGVVFQFKTNKGQRLNGL